MTSGWVRWISAIFGLALCVSVVGCGGPPTPPPAVDTDKASATEQVDPSNQFAFGVMYEFGNDVPLDLAEAVKWYRLAAEQNHTEAIFHLARCYLNGEGVKADSTEAVKWFRKGAELGSADAQWMLGNCYKLGVGVKKNIVQAYALISAAVDGAENPEQKKGMAEVRDKLGKEISVEQLKEAKRLAEEWKAKGKN